MKKKEKKMQYTKDFEKLGLPDDFKFGIELEIEE